MVKMEVGRAWRYSRCDDRNTACTRLTGKIDKPRTLWSFISPDGRAAIAVSADVNQDENNEVVVGGVDNIYVLNGTNGRLLWEKSLTCHGRFAEIIPAAAVFDINRDGSPEIMVAGGQAGATAVSGMESTIVWQHPTLGVTALGFGIFDCDRTDVIQTDLREMVRIYRLRGQDGVRVWEVPLPGSVYDLPVVADINGDGSPEVVLHSRSANGTIMEQCHCISSDGELLWSRPIEPALPTEVSPEAIADTSAAPIITADILGNSRLQVLCLTDTTLTLMDDSGQVIWKAPTGLLGTGKLIVRKQDGSTETSPLYTSPQFHGGLLKGAAVGDINGDGKMEIVVGLWPDYNLECEEDSVYGSAKNCIRKNVSGSRNALAAYSGNTGDLLWRYESSMPCPEGFGMSAPIIADVNGDGALEVAACSADGHLHVINGFDGSLAWMHSIGTPGNGRVIFADINRDSCGELVVTCGDKVTAIGPG